MKSKIHEYQKNIFYAMSKKITLVLAFIGMIMLQGCTVNENTDTIDNDTISEVFELRNVNFSFNPNDGYTIYQTFNPQIFPSDVVLIYRLSGLINSNTPIWQSIPRTLFLPQGELDYDFDFSSVDFTIYAGGTYNLGLTPSFITNQTFRIVIIPGFFGKNSSLDYNDYNAVINAYNIDDSKVKILN
ncbi:hypothetical protein [Flavobacterium sp.]|jgi:hypothetical protein|uniref:hypothetical protein n=1 Tax=Flavobacterium sp. TaxID=239 RepID=UPI0037BFDC31